MKKELTKMPPQAIDFEIAVLGALLIEKEAHLKINCKLQPEHFYNEKHKIIYQAIREMIDNDEPVDLLTVPQYLRKKKLLEKAGGVAYITSLTNRVASAANIDSHSRVINEKYMGREGINISDETKSRIHNGEDIFEVLDYGKIALANLSECGILKHPDSFSLILFDIAKETIKNSIINADKLAKGEEIYSGIPSGIKPFDRATGGLFRGELMIVAARPGMGKSVFASQIALEVSKLGYSVYLANLEMSKKQIVKRIVSYESGVDMWIIQQDRLNQNQSNLIAGKLDDIKDIDLLIDDDAGMTIEDLKTKVKSQHARKGVDLVVVDYLQLMTSRESKQNRNGNREQEISNISRQLKVLAKELDIPVIALSQLSRECEKRSDKRPKLSDLRESGSIEQDADTVCFIHRPEYYKIIQDEEGNNTQGLAEIIISKFRQGEPKTVRTKFVGANMRFESWDELKPLKRYVPKQEEENYMPF
jgi:replicative DNA helicase